MNYNPEIHHRQSIRLRNYDYSETGAYFVTIVTQSRLCMFGDVAGGNLCLNDRGAMISDAWQNLSLRFPNIELDAFVLMPNHIHGIIVIEKALPTDGRDPDGAGTRPAPTTLGNIVGAFKSITTDMYIDGVKRSGWPGFPGKLWQRNYYEHVIRDEKDLSAIREYIVNNPDLWEEDTENPSAPSQKVP